MLDFTKMLCSTFSSLIKDAFSQKKTPWFFHILTSTLSNSLHHSFKVLLLLRAAIWLNFALYFTWRVYFYYHKISPKISIFFQESKRHCQLILKNPNFPDSNWSPVNFTLFSPSCLSVPMTRTAWYKTKLLSLKISECDWTDTMGKETEIFITPCQVKSHFGTAQSDVSNISKNSYVVV